MIVYGRVHNQTSRLGLLLDDSAKRNSRESKTSNFVDLKRMEEHQDCTANVTTTNNAMAEYTPGPLCRQSLASNSATTGAEASHQ